MLIKPLLITIFLESLALFFMKERRISFYVFWIALTSFTNVCINLYIALVFSGTMTEYYVTVAVLETLVFLCEFLLCYAYIGEKRKSAVYSAVCNAFSFIAGIIILWIF